MDNTVLAVVLLLFIAVLPTSLRATTISCSSEITPIGGSFCVGVPIKCTVALDTMSCDDGGGSAVNLTEMDITVRVTQVVLNTPDFVFDQTNFTLDITADYTPTTETNAVRVVVVSSNGMCTFMASTGDIAISSEGSCDYPLSFNLIQTEPEHTTSVKGGNVISFFFEMNITDALVIENVTVANSFLHPALQLVYNTTTVSDPMIDIISSIVTAQDDVHNLLLGDFSPLVQLSSLSQTDMALVNLTFQVQPYVFPESTLYVSFHVFYHYSPFGRFSLKQSIDQIRGFTLPAITIGNLTIDLTHYNVQDYEPDTFPSQEGDVFTVSIPVALPCVSTDIELRITLPEFWSDVYTRYFVNVTDVNLIAPSNLMSIPQLCDFTDLDASLCDFDDLVGTGPATTSSVTYGEQWAAGRDELNVTIGPHMYDLTTGPSCGGDTPDISCNCDDEEIMIVLTVMVLTDVVCENQTITDNITVDMTTTGDMTSWPGGPVTHSEPTITHFSVAESIFHTVNASTPAISLPISSHSGDAGDPFNVTFGVAHNREYSKFTAYDLNYTFSIDPRLDPEENITICFYNSSSDPFCEDVPFVNYTIVRDGYHEIFTLHVHRVELTLEVTVIQDVAPGISFTNPGDSIFEALPDDNPLDLVPWLCTNTSTGTVNIDPVILNPWYVHWSDVSATLTEDPTSTHYITINEQFNTTILACMPECFTGVNLYVSLPTYSSGMPRLTVDDAYVTLVGSELYNTTLFEGDDLATSENITLTNSGTGVTFFFGAEVLVPKDNLNNGTEQCFEIGLLCTILDTTVVHGDTFSYSAYVETDFGIRTSTISNTLTIAEPTLITDPASISGPHDAGDLVTFLIEVRHSASTPRTSAFRLNLTVTYPTEYLCLNESDMTATILTHNGVIQPDSYTVIDTSAGTIVFSSDELEGTGILQATMIFRLTNNVVNIQSYDVTHILDWHNLPYILPSEGRYYSTNGIQTVQIAASQLSLAYTTSNADTPTNQVQLQEYVYINITVVPPEGISPLTVELSHISIMAGDYSYNITYGEVLHIGNSISNATLFVGDNSTSSPNIAITGVSTITFSLGNTVLDSYDNIVNEDDEILLYVEGFVSNDGSGLANQNINLQGQILEDTSVNDMFLLQLVHPQLQIDIVADPTGPWDAGDVLNMTVSISHTVPDAFAAYELLLSIELGDGAVLDNIALLNSSDITGTPGPLCTNDITFALISSSEVTVSKLLEDCNIEFQFKATLPDTAVVAGNNITVSATVTEYYAIPLADATLVRVNYGPTSAEQTEYSRTPYQVFYSNVTDPSNFVAPFETIEVTLNLTVPEGYTLEVYVDFNVTITPPGNAADVSLSLTVQTIEIYPLTNQTGLPYLGDLFNPSDNMDTINDTALFVLTLDIPSNSSGTPFTIFAVTTYNTSQGEQQLLDSIDFVIVRPDVEVNTTAISDRLSRIAYRGAMILFDFWISREDGTFPDYDIIINVTLELPPCTLLNVSLDDLSVISVSDTGSEIIVVLNSSVLSYVNNTSTQMFHFEGWIASNVTDGQVITINGTIEYLPNPYNGRDYIEYFTFPDIYIVEPRLTGSLQFDSFVQDANNAEVVIWELIVSDIAGPPHDLKVDIYVDTDILQLLLLEVKSVGNGLQFSSPPIIVNSSSQAQIVFQNLTLVYNDTHGICSDCTVDIALLIHTELINEVGDHTGLVNATANYSTVGIQLESKTSVVETSHTTANSDTVGELLQVGEIVTMNITIFPPENITTNLTLNFTVDQTSPLDYPVIVALVRILYIGDNVNSSLLSQGDSSSSPHITIVSNNGASVSFGEVANIGDGQKDNNDQITVQMEIYALQNGNETANQNITLNYFLEEEPFIRDTVQFYLIHPQLEMSLINFSPAGPWDAQDLVNFTIYLKHQVSFPDASAYDLQLSLASDQGSITSLTIESTNTSGTSCSIGAMSCLVASAGQFSCISLPFGCDAEIVLLIELPLTVVSGDNITISTALQYDSNPMSSPHSGIDYIPLMAARGEYSKTPYQVLETNITEPSSFVAPFETIEVTLNLTVPEGYTLEVYVDFNVTITPPGNAADVSLSLTLQTIEIYPLTNQTGLPYLGDLFNPSDNMDTINDTALFVLTLDIPSNSSGTPFTIFAVTTHNTSQGEQQLLDSVDFVIVRPDVEVNTTAISDRSSRIVYMGDTVVFDFRISREDGTFPDYDIIINVTLELPPGTLLNVSLDDLSVISVSDTGSEIIVVLNSSVLSYVNNTSTQMFHFEGWIASNVTDGQVITINGSVDYVSHSYNGRDYIEYYTFPDIYIVEPRLTGSLQFDSFVQDANNAEVVIWELIVSDIAGPPHDLNVDIYVDTDILQLLLLEVKSVGNGLQFSSPPIIVNSSSQAQIVFQNLSLVYNVTHGICSDCTLDIVLLIHTELINEVGDHTGLVNATANYSTLGIQLESKTSVIDTIYRTTNSDTVGDVLQVGERVRLNITIFPPEKVTANLTLNFTVDQTSPLDYPVIVALVSILYIGDNVNSSLVSQGDSSSSPHITIVSNNGATVSLGEVTNSGDGQTDIEDGIVVRIQIYALETGNGTANQNVTLNYFLEEEPFVRDTVQFYLIHPQLEMNLVNILPPGPWDGRDLINFTIDLKHQVSFPEASAYDLQLSLASDQGSITSLTIESTNTSGISCSIGAMSCLVASAGQFSCTSLPFGCDAEIVLLIELPLTVVSGDNITISTALQYDSNPMSSPHSGINYTPLTDDFTEILKMPTQILQLNTNYPVPNEVTNVTVLLYFPEGITQNVSTAINISWDTNQTFVLNFNIENILVGSNINASSMDIMTSYPDLGQVSVYADNNDSLAILDSIAITYSMQLPADSFLTNFTIIAESTYWSSNNVSYTINSTDTWTVILRPDFDIYLSISRRLADIGYSITYNVTIVYNLYTELPEGSGKINTTITVPSLLDVLSNGMIASTSQHSLNGISNTQVDLASIPFNRTEDTLELLLPVMVNSNASNETVITASAAFDYTFDAFVRIFTYWDLFENVYLPSLNLTLRLDSTSVPTTSGFIVTYSELATWRIEITNVIGPAENLTLNISSRYKYLGVVDLAVIYIGSNLTYSGMPVKGIVNETASVLFPELTLTNPEAYDGTNASCDCDIIVEVLYTPLLVELENWLTTIDASLTYGSLEQWDEGDLLLTPPTKLTINLTVDSDEQLQGGTRFTINTTVTHVTDDPLDAYNLIITYSEVDQYVLVSDNFTAYLPDGSAAVYSSDTLYGDGGSFNMSFLRSNETLVLAQTYTLSPRTRLGRDIAFEVTVVYSNTNESTPGFTDTARDALRLPLLSLNPLTNELGHTSSSYTIGSDLAINEVFQVVLQEHLLHGISNLEYHTIITSSNGTELPLEALATDSFLPVALDLSNTNESFSTIYFSESELHIIWHLGEVYNAPDGQKDEDDIARTVLTMGILTNASNTDVKILSHVINFDSNETVHAPESQLELIEPDLITFLDIEVLDEGNPRFIEFTTTIAHSENSTSAAFFVNFVLVIPNVLSIISSVNVTFNDTDDLPYEVEIVGNSTLLTISKEVLPIGTNITIVYLAQLNPNLPDGENTSYTVDLDYKSIKQEGIGIQYTDYIGRGYAQTNKNCVKKVINRIPVIVIQWAWMLVWFLTGITLGSVSTVVALVIYYIFKTTVRKRRVVPALLLGMFKDLGLQDENSYQIFLTERKRPLFSSLIVALPEDEWNDMDDSYACAESTYIADVEGDLFYVEGKAIGTLLVYLLETKANLKRDKIKRIKADFDLKVEELTNNLRESMSSEMQKHAYNFVGEKISKTEELTTTQSDDLSQLQSNLTVDMDTASELLDHVDKQHVKEKKDLLSTVELEKKEEELVIIRQYMTHFLLGVKAIAVQTLQEFCPKMGDSTSSIHTQSGEIALNVLTEMRTQEEVSITRTKRQRQCLLEKKLVEEEDIRWEEQMGKLIDNSINGIKHAGVIADEDVSVLDKEVKELFHSAMKDLQSQKKQTEVDINSRAKAELQERVEQLPVFYFQDSIEYSSIGSEIERWHSLQMEREDVLKEVEEKAIDELSKCWERHIKERNNLLEEQTSNLTKHMLSKGVQLQRCDEILRQQSKKRLKVKERMETSTLIQKAKFQARLDRQKDRVRQANEANQQLHSKRMKVEMHFLLDVTSSLDEEQLGKVEQYHKDVANLQRSLALERLRIYLKTKRRVAAQKRRKLHAAQKKYLHQLQNVSQDEQKIKETLYAFIKQRENILIESDTKMIEEERRKAEEDHIKEEERQVEMITNRSLDTVLAMDSQNDQVTAPIVDAQPVAITTVPLDLVNIQDETKKLLTEHKENLVKVNNKLEQEKLNVANSFQKKLKQRQLQRVQVVMDLAAPEEPILPAVKATRFVGAVRKVMLSERMKRIREQHKKDLDTALEDLQKSYEQRRQEAFTKLERKFENHLTKIGKLSHEELVSIFRSIDTWQAELKQPQRRRSLSIGLGSVRLPPIKYTRRLTCPDAIDL